MKNWEQHLFELQIKRDKLDIHDIRGLFQLDEEIGLVEEFVYDLKEREEEFNKLKEFAKNLAKAAGISESVIDAFTPNGYNINQNINP